jgi:hypothetical protein
MSNIDSITLPNKLIIIGMKELSKDKFVEIKNNEGFNKPIGGLWACPYYPNKEYVSAWQEWCSSNMPDWLSEDSIIITLKENTKYYCIANQDNLQDFINIVGEQKDIIQSITGMKLWTYPDFEKAKESFDAIYLTENGAWRTHIPNERPHLNLYGWDCESVLITNFDCIKDWKYIKLENIKEEE